MKQETQMSEWNHSASCLLIIGNISSSWEGEKNTICCTTGQEIHPWVLWVQSCLWIQRVSFIFTERKPGGRRIWDSIYGQDGKPTQMSGVKNSFNWQVKEVCSVGLWWFWQMGFCPCHCVTADMRGPGWWNPASQDCLLWDFFFLVLENPTAQQVGGTRGIIDV